MNTGIRPTILPFRPHDSRFGTTIRFTYTGYLQMTGNHAVIRDDETGEVVYSFERMGFEPMHPTPPNHLQNGRWYNIEIRAIHADGSHSPFSNNIRFLCLTQPILDIVTISPSAEVFNANVTHRATYFQAEGEKVRTFRFTLLDENLNTIHQFPTRRPDADSLNLFSEEFENLEQGRGYFARIAIETVNNMIHDHTESFTPLYIRPSTSGIVQLTGDEDEGFVGIDAMLSQIRANDSFALPSNIPVKKKHQMFKRNGSQVVLSDFDYTFIPEDDPQMVIIPADRPIIYRRLNFGVHLGFIVRWIGMNVSNNSKFLELQPEDGKGNRIEFWKYPNRIIVKKISVCGTMSMATSNSVMIPNNTRFFVAARFTGHRCDCNLVIL